MKKYIIFASELLMIDHFIFLLRWASCRVGSVGSGMDKVTIRKEVIYKYYDGMKGT